MKRSSGWKQALSSPAPQPIEIITSEILGDEFDFGQLTANTISMKLGPGLTKDSTGAVGLDRALYTEVYAGGTDGQNMLWHRNLQLIRRSIGQWHITLDVPHPDGIAYHATITSEEIPVSLFDTRTIKPSILLRTKTSTGFDVQLTTPSDSDELTDAPFTVSIMGPVAP